MKWILPLPGFVCRYTQLEDSGVHGGRSACAVQHVARTGLGDLPSNLLLMKLQYHTHLSVSP